MRELTTVDVESVVGGNLVTGWVPTNLRAIAIQNILDGTFAPGSIRIPGLVPGPIIVPRLPSSVSLTNPVVMWEC